MNLENTKKRIIGRWRNIPIFIRKVLKWTAFLIAALGFDIALIFLLASLTALNVVDWRQVVSLVIVEVLAAVLAKLLGIGEPSELEESYQKTRLASYKARLIPQFAHLKVIFLDREGYNLNYPYSHYRIVNTKTKTCYWVPIYIDELAEEKIIDKIKLKGKAKLEEYLKINKIKEKKRYPKNDELDILSSRKR